ncbi:MAG: peptide-methionine (R)-S-oxide reductase MsrB [Flavobacteriales bacterium]|nr:peptide-methionine (R)-S-oxide reductase MsrB [Flavobacteriales bacterium]
MRIVILLNLLIFIFIVQACGQTKLNNKMSLKKTPEEWKSELTDEEYRIAFEHGTERAFSGEYNDNKKEGMYNCTVCENPLFSSETKYDSGSGWPSFFLPASDNSLTENKDSTLGMVRTEINCENCGAHLGHVFEDGPNPTGLRYCVNSISLKFKSEE